MDDGLEGYSTPRYDPVSGLPVCNNNFPPGTVLRQYQTGTEGIQDRVSGPASAAYSMRQPGTAFEAISAMSRMR